MLPEARSNERSLFDTSRSPTPILASVDEETGEAINASFEHDPFDDHRLSANTLSILRNVEGGRSITPSSRNSSGDCLIAKDTTSAFGRATGQGRNFLRAALGLNLDKQSDLAYNFQARPIHVPMQDTPSPASAGELEEYGADGPPIKHEHCEESLLATGVQVFVAFILAGFGNVGAGLILDNVQHWSSFVALSELFVLVPSLLGLKGNLEMTMAARLSTQANLGHMDDWRKAMKMAEGNICLIQCQATVVAFLASMIAIAGTVFREGNQFQWDSALIICAASLITANIACFLLGICMVAVIILSHRLSIDPDNIATPIAASLGDVTTLALLAAFAQLIYNHTLPLTFPTVAVGIILVFLVMLPMWFYLAYANEYTRTVVTSGWTPVIVAMLISSAGGFILDYGVCRFERIAMFQPVINGVGGNLVAVQASRLSTFLHRQGKPGEMPLGYKVFTTPFKAFFAKADLNVKTARMLLLMAIPAHILYVIVIRLIKGGEDVHLTAAFLVFYLLFALLQVALLLYLAYNLVFLLWKKEIDPDNSSIPILTAFGDFLGSAFLLFAFMFLSLLHDPNVKPQIVP